jgi:alkanesulfonate monooxygenase SsuD/methylene tetrahydromethanopterin reductase-like flavin-dependent oxidoreductase (luciferase family)
MKFALFYEIPVPRPWEADSELIAYRNTLEQAVAGDRFGWDAFWTVEHHFLQEYSHCSNPEVLYGAIAARTERIRLGYGVRLMPKPYNHPVRTAESVAVLDLLSGGRVDLGTGRSATRAELEGFGIDPGESRQMWQEAIEHVVGCWTNEEYEFSGQYWQMPLRRVQPKPLQKPHPPLWGATTADDGHAQMGRLGLGLCSFAVGLPPSEVKRKIDIYRAAVATCTEPIGAFVNNQAATFTMAICAPERDEAIANARESFEWYPKTGARQIATLTEMMAERNQELGNYSYAAEMKSHDDQGMLDLLTLEYLMDTNACVLGTPEECLEACHQYEEAGVDLLLCLVNPYKISHDAVMQTIELMGTHVIPKFRS